MMCFVKTITFVILENTRFFGNIRAQFYEQNFNTDIKR